MLDDDEWAVLMEANAAKNEPGAALAILGREAKRRGLPAPRAMPPGTPPPASWLWPLVAGYEMFTGVEETVANAVWHHRVSLHGPPCPACGKPLRTPRAKLCPACGWGMSA